MSTTNARITWDVKRGQWRCELDEPGQPILFMDDKAALEQFLDSLDLQRSRCSTPSVKELERRRLIQDAYRFRRTLEAIRDHQSDTEVASYADLLEDYRELRRMAKAVLSPSVEPEGY